MNYSNGTTNPFQQQQQTNQQSSENFVFPPNLFGLVIPGSVVQYQFEQFGDKGVPPYEGLEFIGAIADQRPSDIFHTGWSLNPSVNIHSELKLVVQIEPVDKIETCVRIKQDTDLNKEFAKKVALNLFNFMQSFNRVSLRFKQLRMQNDNAQADGLLVVPLNTLDKWFDKFNRKYDLDPNFVFKTE
ncbi:UNKNOWN [Stylonychia lemnae]|uniref:Hikeshi-like C-terminal domain-containing protein n=1 Tax=Stylonychia lemnae TaxID=5949 RepID=A0A078AJV7_STYLE|nr:UNKNOWN [Stylonychia lemnae]|eukprot:CDW82670.1 UNKNOWN [Stylonychia lemnae]